MLKVPAVKCVVSCKSYYCRSVLNITFFYDTGLTYLYDISIIPQGLAVLILLWAALRTMRL